MAFFSKVVFPSYCLCLTNKQHHQSANQPRKISCLEIPFLQDQDSSEHEVP